MTDETSTPEPAAPDASALPAAVEPVPDLKAAPDTAWLKTVHIRSSAPPPDVIFRSEQAVPPEER